MLTLKGFPKPSYDISLRELRKKYYCPVPAQMSGCYAWYLHATVIRVGSSYTVGRRLKDYNATEGGAITRMFHWIKREGHSQDDIRIMAWETSRFLSLERRLLLEFRPRFNVFIDTPPKVRIPWWMKGRVIDSVSIDASQQ